MLRNIAFVGPMTHNVDKLCDYLNENKFKEIFLVTDEKDFYNDIIQIKQFPYTLTIIPHIHQLMNSSSHTTLKKNFA
jgi:hypothetical protein